MHSSPKRVFFGKRAFIVCEEVYEPAEDTFLLVRNMTVKEGGNVLDMGTGCGILAVLAAERAGRVVAVDVNPSAVACTRENAELNNVTAKVEVRISDLFENIGADEKFDLILFNAPYLPVEEGEGGRWVEKAWAGGETGRVIIDRFIDEVSKHLAEKGRAFLVQSSLSNVRRSLERFSRVKLNASVVDAEKWDFEEIVLIEARRQPC